MSEFNRASKVKKQEPKPTTQKGLHHNTSNSADYAFSAKKYNFNNRKYVLADNRHILYEICDKILMHKWNLCQINKWTCSACATSKNVCTKSKYAHRRERDFHKIKAEALESSNIDNDFSLNEEEQESFAISNGF